MYYTDTLTYKIILQATLILVHIIITFSKNIRKFFYSERLMNQSSMKSVFKAFCKDNYY